TRPGAPPSGRRAVCPPETTLPSPGTGFDAPAPQALNADGATAFAAAVVEDEGEPDGRPKGWATDPGRVAGAPGTDRGASLTEAAAPRPGAATVSDPPIRLD